MESPKKNIVILIGQLTFGGAEKQSLLLARALSGPYQVSYVVLKPTKVVDSYLNFLKESRLPFEILEGSFLRRMVRLVRLLRTFQTELLFCYLPGDNITGTLAGRLAKVPYIIGGIRNTKIVKRKFYLLRFVQNHFQNYVIFNSTRAMEIFCSKGYRREKSLVIENAFSEQLPYFERPESEAVKILMVGRFVKQKDYQTGIRAVAGLIGKVGDIKIRLILAGYGIMEPEVRAWISAHGLEKITEFHIQPGNLPELYRSSDIYLNSSIYEGFSNSVMEATAFGLPVVATRTGDIDKQVLHGKSGYISEVGDHQGLCEGLGILCRDRQTRLSYGKQGHEILYSSFGLEPFKKKYIHFIQSLK